MSVKPNFLVVGSAKAGTTSLYYYLAQHPDIFMSPVKEPEYFAFTDEELNFIGPGNRPMNDGIINDAEEYAALFADATNELALGECSTSYLYMPRAADRIKRALPGCKIIIILRQPVDRAYSHYQDHVRAMREDLSFEDALAAENERGNANWRWGYQYLGHSRYYEQLRRYFDRFEREQILICLFDKLRSEPSQLMAEVYRFLGVDDTFRPNLSTVHNPGGLPRRRWLQHLLTATGLPKQLLKPLVPGSLWSRFRHWLVRTNMAPAVVPTATRQRLNRLLKDDVLAVQELTGLDLSEWLK